MIKVVARLKRTVYTTACIARLSSLLSVTCEIILCVKDSFRQERNPICHLVVLHLYVNMSSLLIDCLVDDTSMDSVGMDVKSNHCGPYVVLAHGQYIMVNTEGESPTATLS